MEKILATAVKPKRKKAHKEEQEVSFSESHRDNAIFSENVVSEKSVEGELENMSLEDEAREAKRPERYFEAVGRRKTAVARVRLFTRSGDFLVNNKPLAEYFPTIELQRIAEDALQKMKLFGRFKVSAKIFGGGSHAHAEALRHGLARCLIKFNPDFRKRLKRAGFLKRDPRMKERKKFGLKKARRAPQWQKR